MIKKIGIKPIKILKIKLCKDNNQTISRKCHYGKQITLPTMYNTPVDFDLTIHYPFNLEIY